MTDTTLSLRDHSKPCEHGSVSGHYPHPNRPGEACPGGAEIVLRRGRAVRRTRRKGPYGSVDEFMLVVPSRGEYWVEVNDG